MEFQHRSVLLTECINGLKINPNGVYVDATLGGGGHSAEICRRLSSKGILIGTDRDGDAIAAASKRLAEYNCGKILVNLLRSRSRVLGNLYTSIFIFS